jgi:hypothetical protein
LENKTGGKESRNRTADLVISVELWLHSHLTRDTVRFFAYQRH